MKYFSDFFLPYDSFLETNILLTSMPSILNSFVFVKIAFVGFFVFWVSDERQ